MTQFFLVKLIERRQMLFSVLLLFTLLTQAVSCGNEDAEGASAQMPAFDAHDVLERAIATLGGEERLREINIVRRTGRGHMYLRGQSVYPDGPCPIFYFDYSEINDHEHGRMREELALHLSSRVYNNVTIHEDDVTAVQRWGGEWMADETFYPEWSDLSPERMLLSAKSSSDLRAVSEERIDNIEHYCLGFSWNGYPVKLYINEHTFYPTALEVVRPLKGSNEFASWGDVKTRYEFGRWQIAPSGVCLPSDVLELDNGMPYRSYHLHEIELEATVDEEELTIPEDVKSDYRERRSELSLRGLSFDDTGEIADGLVLVGGRSLFAVIVHQDDGIVIIDAPRDVVFTRRVIDEAKTRFPGEQIKAVVSTSYTWYYFGGLHEYVAQGIPVYVLDIMRPLMNNFLSAPHTFDSDEAAAGAIESRLIGVNAKTTIGTGDDRLEIYPVDSTRARLMVWLPKYRMLFGGDLSVGDLAQQHEAGRWLGGYTAELLTTVEKAGLEPQQAFSLHMKPTQWSDIVKGIRLYVPVN